MSVVPFRHVSVSGKEHVTDGTKVLFSRILTELKKDKLLGPDISWSLDHQGFL